MTRQLLQNILNLPLFIHNLSTECLHLAPAGQLLKNNIIQEWILSNIVNTDGNVFFYDLPFHDISWKNLKKSYNEIKELNNGQLPFGISEIKSMVTNENENFTYFNPVSYSRLKTIYFASPHNAYQLFLYCQKQRRIWWRKFAVNPGRFILSDIIQIQDQNQRVDILMELPSGKEIIETITYSDSTAISKDISKEDLHLFQARDGRKKVLPHLIQCETTIEKAVLSYLCDAYEDEAESKRQVMLFHRKLAPYKTGVSLPLGSSQNSELTQIGMLITKQLRKAGISTLLSIPIHTEKIDDQFKRFDTLGLPYICVLNEATVRNGILGLRNRDTTIKEQIHLSQLIGYMSNLLKNY